jgi:hypothetical protein
MQPIWTEFVYAGGQGECAKSQFWPIFGNWKGLELIRNVKFVKNEAKL